MIEEMVEEKGEDVKFKCGDEEYAKDDGDGDEEDSDDIADGATLRVLSVEPETMTLPAI